MRMRSYILAYLSLSILLLTSGCEVYPGNYAGSSSGIYSNPYSAPTSRTATIMISSEITDGTRSTDENGQSTVELTVYVKGEGEPLGYYQSSTLYLNSYGIGVAEDSSTWFNISGISDGWPSSYLVSAEYVDYGSHGGEVLVKVKIDDVSHRRYGEHVYSQSHSLSWE